MSLAAPKLSLFRVAASDGTVIVLFLEHGAEQTVMDDRTMTRGACLAPSPFAPDRAAEVVMDVDLNRHWGAVRQPLGQQSINRGFGLGRKRSGEAAADVLTGA